MTPTAAARMAQAEVRQWMKETGAHESEMEHVVVWDAERLSQWTGDRVPKGTAALVYEDSMWSAINWCGRLQRAIDPFYKSVLIEPYTDYMLTFYKEG